MNSLPEIFMWVSGLFHATVVFMRCSTVILASIYIAMMLRFNR